jgi:hypothetical protein
MEIKVYGLVNPQGVIENAFYWQQDPALYPVQPGYSLVRIDNVENAGIGWSYVDGQLLEPVEPELQPQPIQTGAEEL